MRWLNLLYLNRVRGQIVDVDCRAKMRDFYLSKTFFHDDFINIVNPLIKCFDDENGIPLNLDNPTGYYSSTTSTALIALHKMNILTPELLKNFHEVIFRLRDSSNNNIVKVKFPEDKVAWDVTESACVWSTAQAIRALLITGYQGNQIEEIKDAMLWLLHQQKPQGGWGFDIKCKSKIYFTALAIDALKHGLLHLDFSREEKNKINSTLKRGLEYVYNEHKVKGNAAFWTVDEESAIPDPTSTLYAIWALHNDDNRYSETISKGLRYLKNDLNGKEIWEMKEIVSETNTKYSAHKVIVSFTPAFPLILLKLGVSPFDDMCIKPIMWLRKNWVNPGWELPKYSENSTLSFTYALGLWTINEWHRSVIAKQLTYRTSYPSTINKLKLRINVLISLIIIIFLALNLDYITASINNLHLKLLSIEPYLSTLAAIITIIGISLTGILKYLSPYPLKTKIVTVEGEIRKYLQQILYAQ